MEIQLSLFIELYTVHVNRIRKYKVVEFIYMVGLDGICIDLKELGQNINQEAQNSRVPI